jgi:hypothetical protein
VVDAGRPDLAMLDGQPIPPVGSAWPTSSKTRSRNALPTIVIVRRQDDRWLASSSRAAAVLVQPLDPDQRRGEPSPTCCGDPTRGSAAVKDGQTEERSRLFGRKRV